ncbi:MAG: Crp/Fnr family transcriptional regulator [Lachnospiraceae bacterium]|nr:Crp/Fnr family transcriptional regulator [Lachnospiraceae bacterium]
MESKQELAQVIARLGGERRQYLNDFFEDCPEELVHAMQYERIPKGQAILQAGMSCGYVWGILNGEISVTDIQMLGDVYSFAESSGFNTVIIGDYEPFAGLAEFQNTIYAVTDCEAFKIPTAGYMRWMRRDSKALFMRAQIFAQTLAQEISNERKYLLLNGRDRLVLYLTQAYGKWGGEGEYILQKTQAQLAQRIGMNVRTVQRSIRKLEADGFVSCRGSKLCVSQKQYEKLKEYREENLIR